jgi:MFS family permease
VGKARSSLIWGTYLAFLWIGGIPSPFVSGLIAERYGLRLSFLIGMSGMTAEAFLLQIFFKEERTSGFTLMPSEKAGGQQRA